MSWLSTRRLSRGRRYGLGLIGALVLILLAVSGTATAAEVVSDDVYHLQQGEIVHDDLTVVGREVIIDGTIEGDLMALAAFVVVNGIVTGDVIALGAEVQINGVVQDDVRVAGAAVQVNGKVGDDLFVAGGSFLPVLGAIPINVAGRTVVSGIRTGPSATIGGDAYVIGGQGAIEGSFRSDLFAAMNTLMFNAEVEGDAELYVSNVTFGDNAYVTGNLKYSASAESGTAKAGGVITQTEPEEEAPVGWERRPVVGFGWWLMRTFLMLVGTGLAGVVVLQLAPRTLTRRADAIQEKPVEAGLYGVLAAVAVLPLSAALVFLAVLFWGWFWGGVAAFAFLFGFFALAWVLSPIVTGLWLGRRLFALIDFQRGDLYAVLVGASVIVLTGRVLGAIPCLGALAYLVVYLLSFALAAGGILLSYRTTDPSAET